MSLKDAFLRTRQAALDIAVERARPKTWKAGRVTQDGVTTVTTDPVAADTPDGTHAELLAAHQVPAPLIDSEDAEARDQRLAPTANRSLVGVMNEFAFLADVDPGDGQELMARLTGNYRRGNERVARKHPRNRHR